MTMSIFVVILKTASWRFSTEKMFLTDLGYEAMLTPGLWIQAWPGNRALRGRRT
jgi:hypothetical protein